MLRLMIGKAGAGKTAAIINEIKRDMASAHGRALMIVPEQYSHEAERELCRVCGDRLSLYAEVLSFTGLARETAAKHGGGAEPWLDKGGRLLCMALALQSVGSRLRISSAAQRRAELQALLLSAVDELKSACIGYDALMTTAASCPDSLGDKLSDLALILEAYDAAVANGHADPADRLSILAGQIDENTDIDANVKIYVDGFIDFTRQEREILHAMLRRGAQLTVCLTVDALDGDNEIFELSRRAGRELLAYARELGAEAEIVTLSEQSAKAPELTVFANNMFSYSSDKYTPARDAIRLYRTESMAAECEQTAALCLEFVRDGGCRWRDIAVVARGFEDYRGSLESAFRHYGVPLFTARRDDLMSKPLPSMIDLAFEIVRGGWAVDDVISYMRTGLAGLAPAECDVLENYIFKWQLQGGAWHRSADWRQHPDGYGCEYTDETEETLRRVNALRRTLAAPLLAFEEASSKAQTAAQQAEALAGLFEALALPEQLSRRAGELAQLGDEKTAAEYRQLWDIVVSALEQCAAVLGDTAMDSGEFSRLFTLMLSKYDIGTIPVSLDRVSAGDFDRNRRRSIKHLIVLGASDQRLPRTDDEAGVFSPEERERLLEMQLELGAGGESELWREFSLIYTCLTMPSESLTMLCPVADSQGAELRPAFVFNRAKALFGLSVANASLSDARMSAPAPALGLAAQSMHGGDARARAAAEYFAEKDPVRYASLEAAANMSRGRISSAAVEKLYGQRLRLSASRIDKFASCRFAYFCQYGLRAKPYEPAAFRPPEIGTFLHYVLEKTARAAALPRSTIRPCASCASASPHSTSPRSSTILTRRAAASSIFSTACAATYGASSRIWRRSCGGRISSRWTLSLIFPTRAKCRRSSSAAGRTVSSSLVSPTVSTAGTTTASSISASSTTRPGARSSPCPMSGTAWGFRCCCISSRSKQTAAGAMTVKSSPRASCTSPRAAASSPCRATRTRSPFQPSARRSSGAAALCARTQRSLRHGSAATISAISP